MFNRIQERVRGRITVIEFNSKLNIIDRLVRILKFGREIRNRTKGDARVRWEGETIIIDYVKFGIADLRTAVHRLLETAKRRLRVDLIRLNEEDNDNNNRDRGERMPTFNLKEIKDSLGVITGQFSFLLLSEND